MNDEEEEPRAVAFSLDRVSPALTLLTTCDLDEPPLDQNEEQHDAKTLQDAMTYLDEFQEQAYLIDLHLESLATPVLYRLRDYTRRVRRLPGARGRLMGMVRWVYHLAKVRGYKAVVRCFPHEVADLDVLLDLFQQGEDVLVDQANWELRYVLLLWLSLVVMLPFDLARWDRSESTVSASHYLVTLASQHILKPGKERDAAAIVLGKLLIRQDVSQILLSGFLNEAETALPAFDFRSVGTLQALCEAVKAGTRTILLVHLPHLYRLLAVCDPTQATVRNPLVRRYRVKLAGRLALVYMPQTRKPQRRQAQTIALAESVPTTEMSMADPQDFAVPGEVEALAQDLLDALEDADTSVRYSASKHLARLVEALPASIAEQMLDLAIESFATGVIVTKDGSKDLSTVSDSRWHGLCLFVAECARRTLIPSTKLSIVLPWIYLALSFDQRRGTRTLGGNIRDAAAYVVWSFARAYDANELAPHAEELARVLILASLFDREIHIRRAASAAFQEVVGRLGIIPHGIALLAVLDYYTCGIRRTAFLVAAPAVASYDVYRPRVVTQLLDTVLNHYDPSMRGLGAQALALVLRDDTQAIQRCLGPLLTRLTSRTQAILHGSLLALAALAPLLPPTDAQSVLDGFARIPASTMTGFQSDTIVEAALRVVAPAVGPVAPAAEAVPAPIVAMLTAAGKKTASSCHDAAADAFEALQAACDCTTEAKRLLTGLRAMSPSVQQCSALCLGRLIATSALCDTVWRALLIFVDVNAPKHASTVEARRNGLSSLARLLSFLPARDGAPDRFRQVFTLLLAGLEDYTSDQRGDVGSLIRMSCMERLVDLLADPSFAACIEAKDGIDVAAGCMRLAVERIDGVREVAVAQLFRLSSTELDSIASLRLDGFVRALEGKEHRELNVVLPAILPFLRYHQYRSAILKGLAMSYGSPATKELIGAALIDYASKLPVAGHDQTHDRFTLINDLITHVNDRINDTRNSFVPSLRLLTHAVSSPIIAPVFAGPQAAFLLQALLELVLQTASAAKTTQRANAASDLYLAVFALPTGRPLAVAHLPVFLAHRILQVREHVAAALYERVLLVDSPEAEALVLETVWAGDEAETAAHRLVDLLSLSDRRPAWTLLDASCARHLHSPLLLPFVAAAHNDAPNVFLLILRRSAARLHAGHGCLIAREQLVLQVALSLIACLLPFDPTRALTDCDLAALDTGLGPATAQAAKELFARCGDKADVAMPPIDCMEVACIVADIVEGARQLPEEHAQLIPSSFLIALYEAVFKRSLAEDAAAAVNAATLDLHEEALVFGRVCPSITAAICEVLWRSMSEETAERLNKVPSPIPGDSLQADLPAQQLD